MRISDWSSDLCSSDLYCCAPPAASTHHFLPNVEPAVTKTIPATVIDDGAMYQSERKIYPRDVDGRFARLRKLAVWVLLGIFYLIPWLPGLASGEIIGCFGLTEPGAGSDPGSIVSRARMVQGGYHLPGSKIWITNATMADVAII